MRHTITAPIVVGSILLSELLGCHRHPKPPKPTPPPVCAAPTIDVERSLVVHDPAILATPFALRRTLQAIIDTSGLGATTPEELLQTMLTSFGASSFVQPNSGKTIPVTPRPLEAGLSAAQLLDPTSAIGMVPVGLFNRLDLAPKDGRHCGEYRIVYAMKPSNGRFLMIFEAALPNPDPQSGVAACRPVAQFWADLSGEPDAAKRVAALESFYYVGLKGFRHVVEYANYGVPFGQVRTNLFVGGPSKTKWMLREHRTDTDKNATVPVFKPDTVKKSPLVEWFRDPSTLPAGITAADQQAFRTHFLAAPVCDLVRPDRANGSATESDVVNGIGANFDPAGDDFQSVSQGPEDDPTPAAPPPGMAPDPALLAAVGTRLTQLGVAGVDATSLLVRSGAMTCGGCHQFSANRALDTAGTKKWPASGVFVHIAEDGTLSPALMNFFLPARQKHLARFVCDPTPEPTPGCDGQVTAAVKPAPVAAAAPTSAARDTVAAEMIQRLTQGRPDEYFKRVDDLRLDLLALRERVRARSAVARTAALAESRRLRTLLEDAVRRARDDERAQPGAFVPVRRPH